MISEVDTVDGSACWAGEAPPFELYDLAPDAIQSEFHTAVWIERFDHFDSRWFGRTIDRVFQSFHFRQATRERKRELDLHAMGPEIRIQVGEDFLASRGAKWAARNYGKYIALSLVDGDIIAEASSLEKLYEVLSLVRPQSDYYVAQVGRPTIGSLDA